MSQILCSNFDRHQWIDVCQWPLRKLIQQLFKVFIEVDSNHYIFDILSDIVPRVDRNANLYINSSGIKTILVEPYVKST